MPNKSYLKGAKFERAVKTVLGLLGECERTFMSGAYTGLCDLTWWWRNRKYGVSCKIRKDGYKTLYEQLEREDVDILIVRSDRKPALLVTYLHDLPHLVGESIE